MKWSDIRAYPNGAKRTITYEEWGDLIGMQADYYRVPKFGNGAGCIKDGYWLSVTVLDVQADQQLCTIQTHYDNRTLSKDGRSIIHIRHEAGETDTVTLRFNADEDDR